MAMATDSVEDVRENDQEVTDHNLKVMLNEEYIKDIRKSVCGMDKVVKGHSSKPWFLRQGCLFKLSRKGYQKRMFFLFNGLLVCCRRSKVRSVFKVQEDILLEKVMCEENKYNPPKNSAIPIQPSVYGFTIYAGDRALMLASMSPTGREDWMRAITQAEASVPSIPPMCIIKYRNGNSLEVRDEDDESFARQLFSQIESVLSGSCSQTEPGYSKCDLSKKTNTVQSRNCSPHHPGSNGAEDETSSKKSGETIWTSFSCNTLSTLCWDRDTCITCEQYLSAYSTNLGGYLLRKLKSSPGWQRLWVTFTQFTLFFHKSHEEEEAIAALPLLGYTLTIPSDQDEDSNSLVCKKNFVFKLYYKLHGYIFRAEDEDTFYQWMDALQTCCRT